MRCNGIPSVYHGTCKAYKSYRRELEGLAKRHRCQFNGSYIFSLCIMVDASPGTSIPVRFINPKSDILRKKSDTPTLAPTSMKTGLQEFIMPSKNVSLPCPPFYDSVSVCPPLFYNQGSENGPSSSQHLFECCRRCQYLKCGTWFISIRHTRVPPHGISLFTLFLCRHFTQISGNPVWII